MVPINGGKELILGRREVTREPYETMFHIIDGETGIKIHSVTYSQDWSCVLYPDPISTHVVVVFDLWPHLWWNSVTRNSRRFSIIQKFSYQAEKPTPFSLVSTDVVVSPCTQYISYIPPGLLSFDPLSMAGVFFFFLMAEMMAPKAVRRLQPGTGIFWLLRQMCFNTVP